MKRPTKITSFSEVKEMMVKSAKPPPDLRAIDQKLKYLSSVFNTMIKGVEVPKLQNFHDKLLRTSELTTKSGQTIKLSEKTQKTLRKLGAFKIQKYIDNKTIPFESRLRIMDSVEIQSGKGTELRSG